MSREEMVFEIGPIRPPSEAGSLLLRVTQGCTWNKCKFCDVYRGTPFLAYSAQEVSIVSIKIQPLYKPRSRLIEAENCQLQDNFILEFVMFMFMN